MQKQNSYKILRAFREGIPILPTVIVNELISDNYSGGVIKKERGLNTEREQLIKRMINRNIPLSILYKQGLALYLVDKSCICLERYTQRYLEWAEKDREQLIKETGKYFRLVPYHYSASTHRPATGFIFENEEIVFSSNHRQKNFHKFDRNKH